MANAHTAAALVEAACRSMRSLLVLAPLTTTTGGLISVLTSSSTKAARTLQLKQNPTHTQIKILLFWYVFSGRFKGDGAGWCWIVAPSVTWI